MSSRLFLTIKTRNICKALKLIQTSGTPQTQSVMFRQVTALTRSQLSYVLCNRKVSNARMHLLHLRHMSTHSLITFVKPQSTVIVFSVP